MLLGLTCAVFISTDAPLKGVVVAAPRPARRRASASTTRRRFPRFTFGNTELLGGIGLIPMMIGMFAVSEIMRYVVDTEAAALIVDKPIGNVFKGMWGADQEVPGADPARQRARHR